MNGWWSVACGSRRRFQSAAPSIWRAQQLTTSKGHGESSAKQKALQHLDTNSLWRLSAAACRPLEAIRLAAGELNLSPSWLGPLVVGGVDWPGLDL
jgi:hypothetical protein